MDDFSLWEEGSFSLMDSSQSADVLLSADAKPIMFSPTSTPSATTFPSISTRRSSTRRTAIKKASYNKAGQRIYCICREPDDGSFMIQCDVCQEWYHGHCLGLTKKEADDLNEYTCKGCLEAPVDQSPTAEIALNTSISVDDTTNSTSGPKTSKRKSETALTSSTKRQKAEGSAAKTNTSDTQVSPTTTFSATLKPAPLDRIREIARKGFLGTFTNIFETIRNAAPDLFEDPFIEDLDLNNPEGVSVALENALFEAYSVMGKEGRLIPSDQYKGKYRSLQFNLKDLSNHRLHARLLTKHVSHLPLSELVKLPPEELGNDQVKAVVAEVRQNSLKNAFKPQTDGVVMTKKTHKGEVEVESPEVVITPSFSDANVLNSDRNTTPLELLSSMTIGSKQSSMSEDTDEKYPNEQSSSMNLQSPRTQTLMETPLAGMIGNTSLLTATKPSTSQPEIDKILAKIDESTGSQASGGNTGGSLDDISALFGNSNDVVVPIKPDSHGPEDVYDPMSPIDDDTEAHTPDAPLPEEDSSETLLEQYDDIIWTGKIMMPQVGKFTGFARQVVGDRVGNALDWEDVLSLAISVEGRIPSTRVSKYAQERLQHGSRMAVVEFFPQGFKNRMWRDKADDPGERDQLKGYETLFQYFHSRDRYAVIGQTYTSVKDMYLVPVKAGEALPSFLDNARGENRFTKQIRNRLLGVIIFSKEFGSEKSSKSRRKTEKPSTHTSRQSSTESFETPASTSHPPSIQPTQIAQQSSIPLPQPSSSLLGLPSLLGVGNGFSGLLQGSSQSGANIPGSAPISGSLDLNLIQSLLATASNLNHNTNLPPPK